MTFCINCGEKIVPDAIFCHKCGTKFSSLLDKPLSEKEYLDLAMEYKKKFDKVDGEFTSVSASLNIISVDSTLEKIDKFMNEHSTLLLEYKSIGYPEIYEKYHMLWISVYEYLLEIMAGYRKSVEFNDQEYLNIATAMIDKVGEKHELALKEFNRIQNL